MSASEHEDQTSRVSSVSSDDARLVDFALRWAEYGGVDEYILPEFGIQPATYYRRLLRLLQPVLTPRLESSDRARLVTLCRSKLGYPPHRRHKRSTK
ncbi:hypothetical protein CJ177_43465 [Rhodococcus sp. ACPA1]|nr:hypothetical protein CJ177_43465 [Rhodococcus sp. ACPA1]